MLIENALYDGDMYSVFERVPLQSSICASHRLKYHFMSHNVLDITFRVIVVNQVITVSPTIITLDKVEYKR